MVWVKKWGQDVGAGYRKCAGRLVVWDVRASRDAALGGVATGGQDHAEDGDARVPRQG